LSTGVPEQLGDRYELGDLLGRGGMAEVHVGRDKRLGRSVAVKMLRPDLARDPSFQARFRREAHSAASLNHPSIVAVYDTGEDEYAGNPVPFIVMEYVEGSTLRDLLASGNRLLPERALEIVDGILEAISYSHQHGIVHRDIKPANVMLTRTGAVKVMDFGIARAVADQGATMTQTSAVIGTAQYLSPEQARGEQVDARSDIYSTGCVLFELLTGRPPFVGESPVSVAYQHVREEPVLPSSLDPDVPPAADAITLKALTKNREDRYQTADEMRADIRRAQTGQRVAAPVAVAAAAGATTQVVPPSAAATSTFPVLPADDEDRDNRGRALAYALLGLAVVAVFIIAALAGKALFDSSGGGTVQVPDVGGLTQAKATKKLTDVGLVVGTVTPRASRRVPKGRVIDQDPPPNTSLAKGKSVDLVVSAGVGRTGVPTLRGLSLDEASQALDRAGLKLGQTKAVNSTQSANIVVGQSVKPGKAVARGTSVDVRYASGSNKVPDVVGKTGDEARNILEQAGFHADVQQRQSNKPAGTVVDQSPTAGAEQRLDSTVTIYEATPPPTTATPTTSPPTTPTSTTTPPTSGPG
jgi:serine/threonine-protein kinase